MRNSNVVDLTAVRVGKDATEDLEAMMRESLRVAIAGIAELHGGLTAGWIDRKTEVAAAVLLAMIEAAGKEPARISLPAGLSDDELEQVRAAVASWQQETAAACRAAFASRLVELLAP